MWERTMRYRHVLRRSCAALPSSCLCLPAPAGLGIHHAGMLRPDRNIMERAFGQGIIKASQ